LYILAELHFHRNTEDHLNNDGRFSVSKLFLVYGAGGAQGGGVARTLVARGDRVRLLLRRAERNPLPGHASVEIAIGDFADKRSLLAASQGADGVSLVMPLIYNQTQVVQWGCNAIDAAQEAGVPLLVFNTSSVVAAQTTGVVAIDIKVELEAYLARVALPSVVLRPTVYNGNLAAPWSAPAIVHQGVLAYPIPADRRVSWISWEELAAYTVAALDSPALAAHKPVFRVGGQHALTGPQLAAQLGEVIGKPLNYLPVPLDQFEAGLNASLGAPVGTEVARFYRWMNDPANGHPLDVDLAPARAALPVKQQTFADWARGVPWTQLAGNAR
jgi:NAD(P)H dehydrogenase (quinone)